MKVSPAQFSMKNFVDEFLDEDSSHRNSKAVHTRLTMQPGEFEHYQIDGNNSHSQDILNVTYCLKELRSIISFADAMDLPLTAGFSEGGQ